MFNKKAIQTWETQRTGNPPNFMQVFSSPLPLAEADFPDDALAPEEAEVEDFLEVA